MWMWWNSVQTAHTLLANAEEERRGNYSMFINKEVSRKSYEGKQIYEYLQHI